jgi:hypothetical protein
MYWVKNSDDTYEVMDGQQRSISICEYVKGNFGIDTTNGYFEFHNLTEFEQSQILNYKLMVYFCEGNDKEKLDWFKTINIAGEKLTMQELRNAVYTGTWLTDAKKYFSKNLCVAYNIGKDYLTGTPIRQDYLETVINWISCGEIEKYMANNQNKPNANELRLYFENVISWVKIIFPKYRKEMKGVEWGFLYNVYKNIEVDSNKLEESISELMQNEDVTNKKGIYEYLLTGNEKSLNIRAFSPNQKREVYERQGGICSKCGKHFEIEEMEADHIKPFKEGGKTNIDNCQLLCKHDNRVKSAK